MSKAKHSLELRIIAQTSIHRVFEAVVGLAKSMEGACAFSCPNVNAHDPPTGTRVLTS